MAIVSSENIVSADESLSWPKTPTTTKHNQNNSGHPINEKSKGDFRGTLGLNRITIPDQMLGDPKWLEVIFWPEKSPDFSYSQKSISNYLKFKHYNLWRVCSKLFFDFFFLHEKFSYIFKCAELMIWARNLHFWILRHSINFTKKRKK